MVSGRLLSAQQVIDTDFPIVNINWSQKQLKDIVYVHRIFKAKEKYRKSAHHCETPIDTG